MFRNYLKIAWRNIWRDKFNSLIKIVGLVAATLSILFAVIYWNDEHNFDSFHENVPNLYRVTTTFVGQKGADPITVGQTGQVQGPAFKEAVPEMKSYVRIMGGNIYNDVFGNDKSLSLNSLFVDNKFFEVFSFPLVYGDEHTVLNEVNSVVITESVAKRYFNSTDVVGEVLQMEADPSYQRLKKPLVISAVAKDPPKNSSIQFDVLLPFEFMELAFKDTNWLNSYLGTFVVLDSHADIDEVTQKFDRVFAYNAQEQLRKSIVQYGFDSEIRYGLQDIRKMHLNPMFNLGDFNGEGGIVNSSSPTYSLVFLGIALLILIIASINFINISLANSLKRANEIGVRKIVGGNKRQIVFQFLTESSLLCIIVFFVAAMLVVVLMPFFNNLTGRYYVPSGILELRLVIYLVIVFVAVIVLTSVYPAIILSKYKPVEVLNNKLKLKRNNLLSRGLIVFQFSLSITLLMAAIIFHNQLDYIQAKDLGYNPDQIIKISITGNRDYEAIGQAFKMELAKEPSIRSVSFIQDYFHGLVSVNNSSVDSQFKLADENYLGDMEIPILLGRNFSTSFRTDISEAVIVNETFVKKSNLEDPIDKAIILYENEEYRQTKTIVGVVKDYHFGSLREPIEPLVISMTDKPGRILVKVQKSR